MNFLKTIFKRPVTVCVITLVCMALGIFATSQMQTNLLPDISYPALGVTIPYPGASAETCDEDVRPLMEDSLKTLSNVKSITTQCIEHASIALILFDYGTDLDKKINEIKDKFSMVMFPENCYDPVYTQVDFNGMAVATVSICNEDDVEQSYEDAKLLKEKLLAIENVGSVSVMGMPETKISISPINGLEITAALIIQTLMTNDQLDLPLGTLEENGKTVAFRNESSAETIEEISETPIQIPLPQSLYSSLATSKKLFEFLQDTPSSEMKKWRDPLKNFYDAFLALETPTSDDVMSLLNEVIPFEDLIKQLNDAGITTASTALEKLYASIENNSQILDSTSELVSKTQETLKTTLNEDFWAKIDTVITFKENHEYINNITGEVVMDELFASDYEELLNDLKIDLPLTVSDELISFIMQTAIPMDKEATAEGNVNLNVKISDVATVETVTTYPTKSYYNGSASVTLQVYGISGANTTAISEAVKQELEKNNNLSSEIILLDDQAKFINDSIENVISSMLIGGVLAIIVIFLFLKKVRTSLIIGITMPFSILCTLICLYFMGITLNMVTLGGLAVGIGMLVDNSIVLIESITFERDKGKTAFQAAVDGTKPVAGSLLASTLTSICVFFPILFTTGLTEMIFADLSWSVIFSLTFSLIVALTVIPTLYCLIYNEKHVLTGKIFEKAKNSINEKKAKKQTEKNTKAPENAQKRQKLSARAMGVYESFLRKCLKVRWLVLGIAVVVFAGSMTLAFLTGTEFLPSVDQKTIEIKIDFDASDNLETCEQQTMAVYDELLTSIPNIQHLSVNVGKNGLASTHPTGAIRLILNEKAKDTTLVLDDVRAITDKHELNVTVTEVDGVLAALMSGIGGISNVSVSISGDNVDTLKEISNKVRARALTEKTYFKSVTDNLTDQILEYKISIDKMKCLELGIDYTVAIATLRVGIAGHTACTAEINGEKIDVTVSFAEGTINEYYKGIENVVIGAGTNGTVTLKDVATITPEYTRTVIKKENGKNVMTLSVESSGIDNGTASKEFSKIVSEVLTEYDGYQFQESGVNHYLSEVFDGLTVSLLISFLLLFAVMACQFESLSKPFIVIFAIPFSFTGGFLGLTLSGVTLNVVSFVGLIMLMGVAVNDAIVLIDKIGQLEEEGLSRTEAIVLGAKSRMRAIWMTTLTTVLALIPLALAIGSGAELMQPLAVVVIGGLTLCTFVTLVIIPVMYAIVKRLPKTNTPTTDNKSVKEAVTESTKIAQATITESQPTPANAEEKALPLTEVLRK